MAEENNERAQVVVIGAGPGGYSAAFRAADLGLNVTLVDAEPRLGGVCLLRGCIPSKVLLHVVRVIAETREAAKFGVKFEKPQIDLEALRDWKNGVVETLTGGIRQMAKKRNVTIHRARASFKDSNTLKLDPLGNSEKMNENQPPEELQFEHAIVAGGSRPAIPSIFDIDDERVMTSATALDLPDIPPKLLVIGGGYIGLEMATVYAALGSEITIVEMMDRLLPGADPDLVKPMRKKLEERVSEIHLNTKVKELRPEASGIEAVISNEERDENRTFDRVLVSVGRQPNIDGLGLENAGLEAGHDGFIKVDRARRTDASHIFAIGDLTGDPMLAHKATREGQVAAESIAGGEARFDNVAIPAVVFTDPEIAWCGLTETEARQKNVEIKTARFPWIASGRAATLGRTEGLTKLVLEPETERILGVGIVGPNAGDLISEGVLAVEMAAVAGDLAESIHPHPTLSETIMEAAEVHHNQSPHWIT